MPEDMQTVPKSSIRGTIGYITVDSKVMDKINKALLTQLDLLKTAKEIVRGELENAEETER